MLLNATPAFHTFVKKHFKATLTLSAAQIDPLFTLYVMWVRDNLLSKLHVHFSDLNKKVDLCMVPQRGTFGAVAWGAHSNVWLLCNSIGPSGE